MSTYRAAVIGLGVMGDVADGQGGRHPEWFRPCCHADLFEMHERTVLATAATRDRGRQERFLQKHGSLPVYSDYAKMLSTEKPDIVSVCTPATVHAEIVIAAAEAGVRCVYCEKAMATTLSDCDAMIAACEKAGTVLAVNHQRRWDDRFIGLRKVIEDGVIGRLQSIQISFGGGRMCRGGSHMFDLARMLAAEDACRGCGWLSDADSFDPGGTGIFETRGGVRIFIDGAAGMAHRFTVEVNGDKGILRVLDGGLKVELWTLDESSSFGHLAQRHLSQNYAVRNPMMNALDDMIGCMEEEGRSPMSSGEDGMRAFEMIAAIHGSHRQDRQFLEMPLVERGLEIKSN